MSMALFVAYFNLSFGKMKFNYLVISLFLSPVIFSQVLADLTRAEIRAEKDYGKDRRLVLDDER